MLERRFVELRSEGERRLSGIAVRYGDTATLPWGKERFSPGAFAPLGDVLLNAQHQRTVPLARTGGAGLALMDDAEALRIMADLPATRAADDVLVLVRTRVLRSLSIEFRAVTERMESGVRIIDKALLGAIGVVDHGAYPASEVEARQAAMAVLTRATSRRRFWS